MASRYVLRVVDRQTGELVHAFDPGREAEIDFVDTIVRCVSVKPVGWFRTQAQVVEAVKMAIEETILAVKRKV